MTVLKIEAAFGALIATLASFALVLQVMPLSALPGVAV